MWILPVADGCSVLKALLGLSAERKRARLSIIIGGWWIVLWCHRGGLWAGNINPISNPVILRHRWPQKTAKVKRVTFSRSQKIQSSCPRKRALPKQVVEYILFLGSKQGRQKERNLGNS